jgi:hypothetical protein
MVIAVLGSTTATAQGPQGTFPSARSQYQNPVFAHGGTNASEAAVARGLKWITRVQQPNGRWKLDHAFNTKDGDNDVAATALALLPFLAAGKTHRPAKNNPYDLPIEKGLDFLRSQQDAHTGLIGPPECSSAAYGHALATILLCQALSLTKDPDLVRPAQAAVNYLVSAQHVLGGWRYRPHEPGDLSVSGWTIAALKWAQNAGLKIPSETLNKAKTFVESCRNPTTAGFTYTGGGNGAPTMTAVGLWCQFWLEDRDPGDARVLKAVDMFIRPTPPTIDNCYYRHAATRAMYKIGGDTWRDWNGKMREHLVKTQDSDQ